MTKLELLKKLREQQLKQDAWVDSLPRDISSVFFDNDFVDSLYASNQLLMREAFGEAYEDADYLLTEWRPGFNITEVDGTEWKLDTVEQCDEYFRKVCGE